MNNLPKFRYYDGDNMILAKRGESHEWFDVYYFDKNSMKWHQHDFSDGLWSSYMDSIRKDGVLIECRVLQQNSIPSLDEKIQDITLVKTAETRSKLDSSKP